MNFRRPVLLAGLLAAAAAPAERLPHWEAGAGAGTLYLADYRGSGEYDGRLLPVPYLIYRGKWFSADREGVRGRLLRTERITLNISASASLVTAADDNPLREGMPELEPTFELGPALDIDLGTPGTDKGWVLRVPARRVYAFDTGGVQYAGWLVHPELRYRGLPIGQHWRLDAGLGLLFGNRRYHDYYYTVRPAHARPGRPVYEAGAGYSGLSGRISLTRRTGAFWYGAYLRYDNLAGAVFEDSPLVETGHYLSLGAGLGWVFATGSG